MKSETVAVAVRLPLDLYKKLQKIAQKDERTISDWLRKLIRREVA